MTTYTKTMTTLSALLLLGLSATSNADAGTARDQYRTQSEVQSCVAEIAKHVDYADAARVVHQVKEIRQKNLVEVEMTIETSIYPADANGEAREFLSSCVVAQLGKVVKLRTG